MMNLGNMMKQAQQMQKRLQEVQEELAAQEIVGESAGGAVKVTCDGKGQFKSIKLSKEAINPENPSSVDDDTVEMLEDIITTAILSASNTAQEKMEAKMKTITGGIKIPGLF